MMRLAALIFLLGVFFVQTEANRCSSRRYSESRAPPLEIRRPRLCRGAGSFIGADYWTSIGYDGQTRDGRSRSDFMVFDQIGDGYIAYWITKTKYPGFHFEAFGHATVRPNGKICAQFVGRDQEIVDVCGGFRILSRNRFNPSEPLPFEWTQATPEMTSRDTLGFHHHRIAKYSWEGENFYGDARMKDKHFYGVNPISEDFVGVTEPFDFERKIWLLRRKDENRVPAPAPIRQEPPKQEDPQWYKYADPHGEERIYMLNRPRQEQENVRPYAPADQRDPRYYDPRYQDARYQHPSWRDEVPQNRPEYDRARLYQTSASSSQDQSSLSGYQEQAAKVAGDNDRWHVVGDNTGTASVGEAAAPSESQRAAQASDVKSGYYIDSYGRQVPVWDTNGRPRDEDQRSQQIGSGTHPEGQRPVALQPGDSQAPSGHSDVQSGYYTDHYGRQIPIQSGQGVGVSDTKIYQGVGISDGSRDSQGGQEGSRIGQGAGVQGSVSGHDIGDGARTADSRIGQGAGVSWSGSDDNGSVGQGVRPNEQERVSFPNSQGEGVQPGSHMARLHRPTIVKDEYGTVYKQTIIDGQVHYIPDPDAVQPVRPDERLVSNPRGDLDSQQWRRQQEHMKIAEEERRLQEQAIRDRWAQGRSGQETIEHVPELPPRREEPVEKDEEIEEESLIIPERLPVPRPVPVEDDEDDS